LKEAEQGSGPGPSKEATSSRDNCAHNGAQIASGMGEETIRMFCPECQKFLVNGVAED
jgi:RNase P subunit RPR2